MKEERKDTAHVLDIKDDTVLLAGELARDVWPAGCISMCYIV